MSDYIQRKIDYITELNEHNEAALNDWLDYLYWGVNYISNRQIALDYRNLFTLTNGTIHLIELGYDIVFSINYDNNYDTYVYVIDMELKTDDYGLIVH